MKLTLLHVIAAATVLATFGPAPRAEQYQCHSASGCTAFITTNGVHRKVVFRRGDLVNTDAGWVLHPRDGWVKVRSSVSGSGAQVH